MQKIVSALKVIGIDLRKFGSAIRGLPIYCRNYFKFRNKISAEFPITSFYPCLSDRFDTSGVATGHYFHQDLLVAQNIYFKKPSRHVDVGSRVDGFVAHVATYMLVEVFDLRDLQDATDNNIVFTQLDLTDIPQEYHEYTASLSCLHTLEHIGLGRYGDRIDVDGYKKGFKNLVSILKRSGILYFSVPIGSQRIEFDAHRVFAIQTLIDMFQEHSLEVIDFSYVDDEGDLHKDVLYEEGIDNNFNCHYGCGIFTLRKT